MFNGLGTTILIQCPDWMNSVGYEDVLKRSLLPIYEVHNIFQQDGAPCHKSRLVISLLDNSKICELSDWPSVSPDIIIIQPLWADLKARVSSCRPTNIEELWRSCEEQLAMIPVPKIKNLCQSIPTRILSLILKKSCWIYDFKTTTYKGTVIFIIRD